MLPPNVTIVLSSLMLSPIASTSPTPASTSHVNYPDFVHPSNGDCKDYIINSTVTFEQLNWAQPNYTNNYDVVTLLSKIAIQGKVPFSPFSDSMNVTQTF